jgi:hypothetical protein
MRGRLKDAMRKATETTGRTMALYGKDVSDWAKVIVMLGLAFMAYQHLVDRVDASVRSQTLLVEQTTRIERYLSAKDPNYWVETQKMAAPAPATLDPAP